MAAFQIEKNRFVKWKQTGKSAILLNLETGEYFELDEIGASIWRLLTPRKPLEQVARQMAVKYKAPLATIERDVRQFVDGLIRKKLLRKIPARSGKMKT